jgi:hypothetical protein
MMNMIIRKKIIASPGPRDSKVDLWSRAATITRGIQAIATALLRAVLRPL